MPADDVSDLRDVVDAINRLCETMKTSAYDGCEDVEETSWQEAPEEAVAVEGAEPPAPLVGPEQVAVQRVHTHEAERWSDPSPPDTALVADEHAAVCFEPQSEMYYTASEVSLLSDMETPDRAQDEERVRDDRQSVMAGHVAAMRERFESMTRANTPCPDLARSLSPSLDLFTNTTPSPDRLD